MWTKQLKYGAIGLAFLGLASCANRQKIKQLELSVKAKETALFQCLEGQNREEERELRLLDSLTQSQADLAQLQQATQAQQQAQAQVLAKLQDSLKTCQALRENLSKQPSAQDLAQLKQRQQQTLEGQLREALETWEEDKTYIFGRRGSQMYLRLKPEVWFKGRGAKLQLQSQTTSLLQNLRQVLQVNTQGTWLWVCHKDYLPHAQLMLKDCRDYMPAERVQILLTEEALEGIELRFLAWD